MYEMFFSRHGVVMPNLHYKTANPNPSRDGTQTSLLSTLAQTVQNLTEYCNAVQRTKPNTNNWKKPKNIHSHRIQMAIFTAY